MKIKGLLLGMMACAALVACTNDDIVDENGNVPELKGNGYIAVEFAMAGNGTGRAASLDGFTNADPAEVEVTSATFFFLGADGNSCADPFTIEGNLLTPWVEGTNGDNINETSAPVIVMENPTATPASIVAILNPTSIIKNTTTWYSLSDLQGTTLAADYRILTEGNFVMSNSVYMDANGKAVVGAPVSASNIKESKEAAKADPNPVRIPVERVVAKVDMVAGENVIGSNPDQTITGSNATTITVAVKGWWLDNTNPTSYLIKNIESYTYTWNWNDLTNKRSYWATSAAGTLEHASYNDMDLNAKYCLENTSANHTKMVVAAELQINGTATTLIQWRNNLYTEDGFKTQIANLSDVTKYFICTNEDAGAGVDKIYVSLTKDNLEFAYNTNDNPNVTDKDWQAIVKVNDKTSQIYTIATVGGEKVATPVSKETVNASFANIATFKMWNGGKTYFFTDIEHNGDLCGIVRNHLYNLTISSITGLGTPVPNPDKEIIPEKPTDDEESYIAAKVEILSYKVVSQSVDLN
jgi:YHS domain-containing protein